MIGGLFNPLGWLGFSPFINLRRIIGNNIFLERRLRPKKFWLIVKFGQIPKLGFGTLLPWLGIIIREEGGLFNWVGPGKEGKTLKREVN